MQQLTLWTEPESAVREALPSPEQVWHNHIRVKWLGGREETYCTAADYRPVTHPGEWEWEAGFVGLPMKAEACSICNNRREL